MQRKPPGPAGRNPRWTSFDWILISRWASTPVAGNSPNFGYVTDTFWFRINPPDLAPRQLLEISYPHLDDVRFFRFDNGRLEQQLAMGDQLPFDERPVTHPYFVIPLDDVTDATVVYLRVATSGALQVPLRVWEQSAFFEHASAEDQLHAMYYGILITAGATQSG